MKSFLCLWHEAVKSAKKTGLGLSLGFLVKSRVFPPFLQGKKLMKHRSWAGREWITMDWKRQWRAMQIAFKKDCKCFILLQTLHCFLIFLPTKIWFFIMWHRKRCLLYWQLKAWFDQLVSGLKIFWIKFKSMDFFKQAYSADD